MQRSDSNERIYLEGRVKLEIYPKNLASNGKSIGHIIVRTYDMQRRSIDGSYPVSISLNNAAIITKSDNQDFRRSKRVNNQVPFMTRDNTLHLNYIPNKNSEESEFILSTPWGDIRDRIKFTTGLKYSVSETLESVIYAFIIAIVLRTFLWCFFYTVSVNGEYT